MNIGTVLSLAVVATAFGTATHAGNIARFYRPNPSRSETLAAAGAVTFQPSSGDVIGDIAEAFAEGRVVIGASAFNGPSASDHEIEGFAKKIGAQYVITGSKYLNSVAGAGFGSSTFTRFGAFSFFIPSSIDRFDQVDLFLADTPRKGIGIAARPLKASEAAALGTNKGMMIAAVRRGSPAFNADILPEDLVTRVGSNVVYGGPTLKTAVEIAYGTTADVTILRGGKTIIKQVVLSNDGTW